MDRIDHILYATPDLEASIDEMEKRLGVRAILGGRHPAYGTRNALLALGPDVYFEIIGPDVHAPSPASRRILGIDKLKAPRLATWAARGDDLDGVVERAELHGVELGRVRRGSRMRPDGSTVSWQLTDVRAPRADGLIPFFIHWDDPKEHPVHGLPTGCTLAGLRGEHPDAEGVRDALGSLGIDLAIDTGPAPALVVTIESPRGTVEIR